MIHSCIYFFFVKVLYSFDHSFLVKQIVIKIRLCAIYLQSKCVLLINIVETADNTMVLNLSLNFNLNDSYVRMISTSSIIWKLYVFDHLYAYDLLVLSLAYIYIEVFLLEVLLLDVLITNILILQSILQIVLYIELFYNIDKFSFCSSLLI